MHIVNAKTMQGLDQRTIQELGLPAMVLMERAALGISEQILKSDRLQNVQILAGTGNNGGDGLAIARLLQNQGHEVKVWLLGDDAKRSPDNQTQLELCQRLGIVLEPVMDIPADELKQASLIVDALFGVGLSRKISGEWAALIEAANASQAYKVAVDIPSGIHSDTGEILGTAFKADLTVSCALPKWAHLLDKALESVGRLEVVDIGIPPAYLSNLKESVLDRKLAQAWKPGPRAKNSHKGSYGSLAIIGGALGMSGAARMAAEAALQTGVGLVFLFVPASIQDQLAVALPEVQVVPLPEVAGQLGPEALPILLRRLETIDAVLLGPGLGRGESVAELVKQLLPALTQPLVIDADGLWHLAEQPGPFQQPVILTPHPGELARLVNHKTQDIQADRVGAARAASQAFNAIMLLKGARSLIAAPDERLWFNAGGNPGMARGGMGDVLAGLCAGLLTQGLPPEQAAGLATYWHALAGDTVAADLPETAVTVQRLLAALPEAWQGI